MGIRNEALQFFTKKYGDKNFKTYTSKFYLPHESWPKKDVWWLQIPLSLLNTKENFVNLLCQVTPLKNEFHYLKVPVSFFQKNLDKFHIVAGKLSLYLSASEENKYKEIRGNGNLDFGKYRVD